jgi:hypothetical protein
MANKETERLLVQKIKDGKPKNKHDALEFLALMMASGRVKKPATGGPPPQPKSEDE